MDLLSYVASKAKGGITLTKLGPETYQIVAKKFDAATGVETYPEVLTVSRQNVKDNTMQFQSALTDAQSRVDGLALLVKDLDALDAV
jgi:hypothetical protein